MKTSGFRNITFVNQYVNHLFVDIMNVFAKKGYRVTLLTGGIYSGNLHENVKVIKLNAYKRDTFLKRVVSWKLFTLFSMVVLPFTRGKLVLSSNPPFLFPLVSVFRWAFRREIYPIVYDLYPDALINFGYVGENSFAIAFWKRLNTKLFRTSSAIFTISAGLTEAVKTYGRNSDGFKVTEIPVWGDDGNIKPVPKSQNPFVVHHGLAEKFVVQYSGNFGLTHDIETILDAALLLKNEKTIRFLMVGKGAKQRMVKNFIAENELENVILLPWQPVEELAYSLSSADVGLITLPKNAEAVSLPSKTFSYLKAGVPVLAICGGLSGLAAVVKDHDCGVVCEEESGPSLAREIRRLKGNKELVEKLARNALLASEKFSSANAEKFYEVISGNDTN